MGKKCCKYVGRFEFGSADPNLTVSSLQFPTTYDYVVVYIKLCIYVFLEKNRTSTGLEFVTNVVYFVETLKDFLKYLLTILSFICFDIYWIHRASESIFFFWWLYEDRMFSKIIHTSAECRKRTLTSLKNFPKSWNFCLVYVFVKVEKLCYAIRQLRVTWLQLRFWGAVCKQNLQKQS